MILVYMNVKSGITNSWRTSVNLSLTKNYFSAFFFSDILRWLPPPLLAGMSKYQASELLFPLDFRAFSAFLAIQNV